MLEMEIKIHPEPHPITYATGTGYNIFHKTKEEEEKCAGALVSAKALFGIGDTVMLTTGRATVTIVSFNEDTKEMRMYRENPCPLKAINLAWQNPTPIDYSLEELDLSTITKKPTEESINTESAND